MPVVHKVDIDYFQQDGRWQLDRLVVSAVDTLPSLGAGGPNWKKGAVEVLTTVDTADDPGNFYRANTPIHFFVQTALNVVEREQMVGSVQQQSQKTF
jgi:hypothetical protein